MAKQKPILEWLEMLPDGYREICIQEYDPEFGTHRDAIYLKEAVSNLCNWNLSKIKDNFLYDLWLSIRYDNSIDFAKLPPLPENWKDLYEDKLPEQRQAIKKPKNPNKKRNKLAVKIFLAWAANPKAINGSQTFDTALEVADQIIKKLNQ